jgi:aryl-alcohol dehydrogenase-like predicted oxidoreductase
MSTESPLPPATFKIGGELEINRLGFGAMRITGRGVWGQPNDRAEVIRTLRRLPELGVDFVDTADSYGPYISEELIRDALHPYQNILIATKAGLTRSGPDKWAPLGRPEYLIAQALASRERLGVDQIALWQLHRIDPHIPRDEQFDAVRTLIESGIIRHAGLSQVSVEDIKAASKYFKVATVQNRFNLYDRHSAGVLDHCAQNAIGFIPWYPLGAGQLARSNAALEEIAGRYGATPSQIALAWLLQHSPVMLPIPGTSRLAHLDENMKAQALRITAADIRTMDALC